MILQTAESATVNIRSFVRYLQGIHKAIDLPNIVFVEECTLKCIVIPNSFSCEESAF